MVPLGIEPPEEPRGPRPRTSRLHSFALFITTLSAVLAILSTLAFVTVNWAGPSRRIVIAVLIGSIVMFMAGVCSTILSAARDTYAKRR